MFLEKWMSGPDWNISTNVWIWVHLWKDFFCKVVNLPTDYNRAASMTKNVIDITPHFAELNIDQGQAMIFKFVTKCW